MELVFTTPGAYISVKDGLFAIKTGEQKTAVAPAKVDRIILTTEAVITTAVIKLAVENNIDLIVLERNGDPVGRFWHSRFGSITTIRRKQLELHMNEKGLDFAKEWIVAKLSSQIEYCKELAKNRKTLHDGLLEKLSTLEANREKLTALSGSVEEKRGTITGLEGSASKVYFEILALSIPEKYRFSGRSRQPARDPFNAFLNYAYGVLYSIVEKACIIAGLDPYIGFLHTDNYNKPSLVFDVIENFRIYADRVIFRLFSKKQVNDKMFDQIPDGFTLNKEGKRLLFDEYNKYLEEVVHYGNKNMSRSNTVQAFCHKFANSLIQE
ncbi:MAG: CRISPR-associated endonuclease Cas1 [Candidatus Aminicenantes bacterium]|nr:CRISPR-associated endonuclease Cas1 [Candidatus Aminicenantes bacterium]